MDLERIEATPAYTFLLYLFEKQVDNKEIIKILSMLKTFLLRRQICEYRTAELDTIFAKLSGLDRDNIVNNLKSFLLKELPKDEQFKESFENYIFKGNDRRTKYILAQFENYFTGDTGEKIINLEEDVELEHIIPQTIDTKKSKREYGDWVNYLDKSGNNPERVIEKHRDYVHRIGNLTLLAGQLNVRASNNPFRAKLKEYKKSSLALTKEVAENYSRFKFKNVGERSKELSELAVKIWFF